MTRFLVKPLAMAFLALGAAHAQADSVDFLGFANGSKTVHYALSSPNVTKSGNASAGGLATTLNGGPSFTSYCVDLYETIVFSDPAYANYHLVDGSLHAFANGDADADIGKLFSAGHALNNATAQAAFQIAIWEISYETASVYNLASGSAQFSGGTAATSGALTLAGTWLSQLGSVTNTMNVEVLENFGAVVGSRRNAHYVPGHQDVVFAAPVPEPSTYALMVAGLLSMGFIMRRRSRHRA